MHVILRQGIRSRTPGHFQRFSLFEFASYHGSQYSEGHILVRLAHHLIRLFVVLVQFNFSCTQNVPRHRRPSLICHKGSSCSSNIPSGPNKTTFSLLGRRLCSNCSTFIKHGILTPVPDTIHSPGPNTVNESIAF